jgi:hypothetical protein
MSGQSPNLKLRNWLVLIVLAAFSAFVYAAVMAAGRGF